ncbi:guanine nucleotide-binding protein subunit gamma 3-like [Vicia villosa]|uniref:guanine nucleotide-binding protein subunit gamma 3-like n=1 Tax=Vicia villosa TaxID=3911 RepID=UPI00273AFF6B|nr:guanine nucleotide-binding protein subunit gamma 3-like [Vicia villosa]
MVTTTTTPTKHPSSNAMSLPFPSPKPPPEYPDLYGKRREMARVQMLEREISFLEEELKSSEGFQPSSKCCKEIADFVTANSDPLLPMRKKNRKSCCLGKWLRYEFYFVT